MKIPALLLLLLSPAALAATPDPSDATSANLISLDYYLRPGALRSDLSFSSQLHEESGSNTVSFLRGTFFLEYGLPSDGLRVSVSESQAITAYNGQASSDFFSGVTEPTFQVNYRFCDGLPGGWSFDGQVDLTPSFGTYTYGSSQYPGTQLSPSTSLGLTAAAFLRQGPNETRFSGNLTHRFTGSFTSQVYPGQVTTSDPYWTGSLAITDRLHVVPRFYVQAETAFDFGNSINYTYADGSTSTSSAPFHVDPTVSMGYLANSQLLLTAHLSYAGYTSTLTASSSTFRETSWGATAVIEF